MTEDEFCARFDVSRETYSCLQCYLALLVKWNARINLIASSTLATAWDRHFVDSAQLWQLAEPRKSGKWVDLGSGGGFPGLVLATIAAEKAPDIEFVLVESDTRKAVFLRNAVRELGLGAKILDDRVENLPPLQADVISARALAPLAKLLDFAERHGKEGTLCLFPKGRSHDSELTEARKAWHISSESIPSLTDPNSVILKIGGFHRG